VERPHLVRRDAAAAQQGLGAGNEQIARCAILCRGGRLDPRPDREGALVESFWLTTSTNRRSARLACAGGAISIGPIAAIAARNGAATVAAVPSILS